jgi:opacity protein-like surface antigen
MHTRILLIAAAALAVGAPAGAKNPARGWFVGLDAGTAQLDGEVIYDGLDTFEFDENSAQVAVHAGYRFSRFLSLGLSFTDFGDFSVTYPDLRLDAQARGVALNFVARIPLNERLGLQATVSVLGRDLEITSREPGEAPLENTTRGLSPRLGLGLGYRISDHLDVRVDFATTPGIGHVFMGMGRPTLHFDGDLDSLTAGVRYKF